MSYQISLFPIAKLSEFAEIKPGFAFKSDRFVDDQSQIPLVKGENVQQGYIDWVASKYWPKEEYDLYKEYHLKTGDVVVAMDRPWVTAGLKWSYIKDCDPQALLVQRVARIRSKRGLDQTYLRCLISSNYFSAYIQPIVTGVNVPHISAKQIGDFKIPAPNYATQKKIAAILSAYDDLIENNKRRITLLEKMAEEIYREWFVRFRFPGWRNVEFMKGVPKGWDLRPFSELVHINPTERLTLSDSKPYVGMEALSTSSMYFESSDSRRSNSGSKFRNRDTLFPRITPCLENGKRGYVSCLADNEIGIGSTEFIVIREKILTSEYIYLLSCFEPFRVHAEISMVGASGRQRVSENCFSFFLVTVPPPDVLNSFSSVIKPIFEQVKVLSQENKLLEKVKEQLLPRLISGKLSVENLDIQFPPSVQKHGEVEEKVAA